MAGIVRTGEYPLAWDRETNPPPLIPGWDAEQSWAWHHPEPPAGYTWATYVDAVSKANMQGEEGPRPLDAQGRDMAPDMSPQTYLQYNIGYGKLAPLIAENQRDEAQGYTPDVNRFLDSTYYANTSHDDFNIFGDQFFPALLGLGAAVGGAAALGGFAAAPAAGGAAAGMTTAEGLGLAGPLGLAPEITAAEAVGMPWWMGAAPAGAGGAVGGATGGLAAGAGGGASGGGAAVGGGGSMALGTVPTATGAGGVLGTLGAVAPYAAPLIGAGTTLIGGMIAGNAAKAAADTQANAINNANNTLLDLYNRNRADMQPYLGAGYAALGQLAQLADTPNTYGAYAATAPLNPWEGYQFDPGQYALQSSVQPLSADQYQFRAAQYAFTPPSGQQVLEQDPGHQFRVNEGRRILEGSAASKGGLLSGGTLRGLTRLGQELASQEYGNAYNRLLGQNELAYERALNQNQMDYQRALAENEQRYGRGLTENQLTYERGLQGNQLNYARGLQYNQDAAQRGLTEYQTNFNTQMGLRNQRYNELANIAGLGQVSTGQQAGFTANLGSQLANNITSAGAAQAAGQVGAANALNTGLAGIGNAANSYLNYSLLQNQLAQQQQQYNTLLALARR